MARWIAACLIFAGLALIVIRLRSRHMEKGIVFFPERDIYVTPDRYGLKYEDVFFETEDQVRLHGWFVPGDTQKIILWFHGNAGNIADRADNVNLLVRKVGASVFIFDYREYGKSEGSISKAGTFLDAEAAYRYLIHGRGVKDEHLVLFGRSLGSALAVHIASKYPAGHIIIESAFTSSDDVANLYYPYMKHLLKTSSSYRTSDLIGTLTLPKLVIHGERDEIIPLWMGEKLFDLAAEPKELYIIPGAAHNDTYVVGGDPYFEAILEFLKR